MAIQRQAVLEAVLERLGANDGLSDLQREVFPDSAEEFRKRYLKSRTGALLASYAGTRKERGGEARPNRTVAVDLSVLSAALSGDEGALARLDTITTLLDGVKLVAGGEGFLLSCRRDQFVQEVNGIWHYTLRLDCERI